MNTLKHLKEAIDTAIQTYAHCLVSDCVKSGINDMIDNWATLSCELSEQLDAILNKEGNDDNE